MKLTREAQKLYKNNSLKVPLTIIVIYFFMYKKKPTKNMDKLVPT